MLEASLFIIIIKWLLIRVLLWITSRTILSHPNSLYLNLFPGIMKKYPSVSLKRLVKLSITFSLVMSLVSNPSWFHLSTLHAQYGSRPQFSVSSVAMLPLDDSVLAIFIFMPAYLLNSF